MMNSRAVNNLRSYIGNWALHFLFLFLGTFVILWEGVREWVRHRPRWGESDYF